MDIFDSIAQPNKDGASLWSTCAPGGSHDATEKLHPKIQLLFHHARWTQLAVGSLLAAPGDDGEASQIFQKDSLESAHELSRTEAPPGTTDTRTEDILVSGDPVVLVANTPCVNAIVGKLLAKDKDTFTGRPSPVPFCPSAIVGAAASSDKDPHTVHVSHESHGKQVVTDKASLNAFRNMCFHNSQLVAETNGSNKTLTPDGITNAYRRIPTDKRTLRCFADTELRTALFSALWSEVPEKGKIAPADLYGASPASVADFTQAIMEVANAFDSIFASNGLWHTFFHTVLESLKKESAKDIGWLDYAFRCIWLEIGATLREEALATDLTRLYDRLRKISNLEFSPEIFDDFHTWSTERNNAFRESLSGFASDDEPAYKRKKLPLNRRPSGKGAGGGGRGGGGSSVPSSPSQASSTANRGKKNAACFAYATHAAAVPGQGACKHGNQCGFSHSPFGSISASQTLQLFDPLFKRSFPVKTAQDEARRLVTAWATAPGTGFAP